MKISDAKYDISNVTLRGVERSGRITITMGRRSATAWYYQIADYTGDFMEVESEFSVFAAYVEARRSAIEEALTNLFNTRDAMAEASDRYCFNGVVTRLMSDVERDRIGVA